MDSDDSKNRFKLKADNLQTKKAAIITWAQAVLSKQNIPYELSTENFLEQFQNGTILCKIMNILNNNCIAKIKTDEGVFASIDNINAFINACREYGLNSVNNFNSYNFIMESKNSEERFIEIMKELCVVSNEKGLTFPNFDFEKFKSDMEEKKDIQDSKVKRLSKNYLNTGSSPIINSGHSKEGSGLSINTNFSNNSHSKDSPYTSSFRSQPILENSGRSNITMDTPTNEILIKMNAKIEQIESNQSKLYNFLNDIYKRMEKMEVNDNMQNKNIEKLATNTLSGLEIMNQQLEVMQSRLGSGQVNAMHVHSISNLQTSNSTSSINNPPELKKQPSFLKGNQKLKFGHWNHNEGATPKSALTPLSQCPTPLSASDTFSSSQQLQFSTLPDNILQMNLSRQENMRLSVVYELFSTEADYVRDLGVIINCLMENISKSQLLSEEEFNGLFSNVKDLIVANQEFNNNLIALKEADPVVPEIGNEFLKIAEKLKVYKEYCSNYPLALSLLRELTQKPDVKNLLTKLATDNQECRGLNLEAFLIKPVQRICKYPLMIRELIKYTSKDSKDYPVLENALNVIENVIAYVNEGTKKLEEKERLTALQARIEFSLFPDLDLKLADKHMVKEGNIQRLINSKAKDRYMYLFNDCILICKEWTASYKYKYQLEEYLAIDSVILKNEITEKLPKGHTNVFQLIPRDTRSKAEKLKGGDNFSIQPITLSLLTDDQKREWSQSIWDTMTESKKALREAETMDDLDLDDFDDDIEQEIITIKNKKEEFPSLVEINGVKWKKAVAATGQNYYFNTVTFDTVWKLPNEYYIVDVETGEKFLHNETENDEDKVTEKEEEEADNEDEDEYYNSENVEGYPDWKMVKMENNITYYFNKKTEETQWEHPGAKSGNESPDKKTINQLQKILVNASPTQ